MSDGFSVDWLALREPHDHRARDAGLTGRLLNWLEPATKPIRIIDLGCGTGSNLRYLAPRLPVPQHWHLIDHDPALLARIAATATIEPRAFDLSGPLDDLPWANATLVTASALLDLVSEDWLQRLVQVAAARPAFLFALSYDGRMRWDPVLPGDSDWLQLFNRHQAIDKGFGPALGPTASDRLIARLKTCEYRLHAASTPWHFCRDDAQIQQAIATGSTAALTAAWPENGPMLDAWLAQRLELIGTGRSSLMVGHQDVLGLPLNRGLTGN